MSLHISVSWATDCHGTLATAWLVVSDVVATVWLLAMAPDVVLWAVAVDGVGVGGRDMATSMGGSERETRGCRACRGSVG
jgi:hypothetical protein